LVDNAGVEFLGTTNCPAVTGAKGHAPCRVPIQSEGRVGDGEEEDDDLKFGTDVDTAMTSDQVQDGRGGWVMRENNRRVAAKLQKEVSHGEFRQARYQ
jgi:hypothetical protein